MNDEQFEIGLEGRLFEVEHASNCEECGEQFSIEAYDLILDAANYWSAWVYCPHCYGENSIYLYEVTE